MVTVMIMSSRLKIVALMVMFLIMPFGALAQSASVPASTVRVADTTIYNLISASGTTVLVSGLDPLKVVVSATSGTLKITTTTGLSAPTGYTTGQWSGASEIAFEGTLSNVNNALATLQYLGVGTITISPTSSSILYYSGTGNYYEFISTGSSWTAAQSNANSKTYGSSTGYLTTVTSAAEFNFILSKAGLSNEIWLGGSDSGTEGVWQWKGGPENGQQFWQGKGTGASPPGSAVGGFYTSWNGTGEPNDSGSNEDCLAVLTNGKWNDYPCSRSATYVIEYDGTGVNSSQSFQVAALLTNSISFPDINKFVGDTPFNITDPTSSSTGAFSYTSSNTAVATVSGNTVTVLSSGTSTITLLQASDGTYGAASATATLTVSEGGPNDPEVAFQAIKTNIEETSTDNVYKNSIEHLQSNEFTLNEQIMFHSEMEKQKTPQPFTSFVDYNVSIAGEDSNILSNGHYHHTELMGNKFRRRVLVDAKKVFFKGDSTTTVFTSSLLYDFDFDTQTSKQVRLGMKLSNDKRSQTLEYKSEAKTIFVGTGLSHKFREGVFGGVSGDILYSSTDSTYTNQHTNVEGALETYSLSASAKLLGQFRSNNLEAICKKAKWCPGSNVEFWIKPALNLSYSREHHIDQEFTSITRLGRKVVYPSIAMPTVVRVTLEPEFSYHSIPSSAGIKKVFGVKPSYACEVLKTNSKTEVCSFGLSNKLDLMNDNKNFISSFYFNYENLNLGARHEYGLRMKVQF